jgi:hypothetical protein
MKQQLLREKLELEESLKAQPLPDQQASEQDTAGDTQMKDTEEVEVIRHNIENEEWIEDHTGVKRKPFRVMQREVSTTEANTHVD